MTGPAPAWPLTASLLLLLLPQVLPDPCSFPDSPISSTFAKTISNLLDFMLWDYPVDVPENLRVDEQCWALWHLALAKETLGRLKLVAGSELQELLEAVYTEINFVGQCVNQSFPGCLRFRKANISHLLLEVSSHLGALQPLITQRNFRPCQQYRCQPGEVPRWALPRKTGLQNGQAGLGPGRRPLARLSGLPSHRALPPRLHAPRPQQPRGPGGHAGTPQALQLSSADAGGAASGPAADPRGSLEMEAEEDTAEGPQARSPPGGLGSAQRGWGLPGAPAAADDTRGAWPGAPGLRSPGGAGEAAVKEGLEGLAGRARSRDASGRKASIRGAAQHWLPVPSDKPEPPLRGCRGRPL